MSLLLAISQSALAEWEAISANKESYVAIDKSRIIKIGNSYRVWEKYSFKAQQKVDTIRFRSMLTLVEYNCAEQIRKNIEIIFYEDNQAKGKIVESLHANSGWNAIVPESYADTIMNVVCKQ